MKTSFAIATILLEVGRTAAKPAFSSLPLECERLLRCLTEVTKLPVKDDIFGAVGLESASTDDICHDIVLFFGGETGTNAICGAADAMTHTGSTMTPEYGQLQAATCSSGTPKDPDYPSGGFYDALIAENPVVNPFLFGGSEERSDANAYSGEVIALLALRVIQAGASSCSSIPIVGAACEAAKKVAEVAIVALEVIKDSLDIQDGLIDAAEIQAAYLNTNTIISQNCVIEGDIANLQADSDLDSLLLSIEPTDHSKTAFLVLSAERGVETGIDLVIDCYDEGDEMYRTQPFTRTEISEGTTLVKFPKSEKNSKSKKSGEGKSGEGKGKGKGGCNKIRRFKGTAKKASRSGVRSTRTVLRRK